MLSLPGGACGTSLVACVGFFHVDQAVAALMMVELGVRTVAAKHQSSPKQAKAQEAHVNPYMMSMRRRPMFPHSMCLWIASCEVDVQQGLRQLQLSRPRIQLEYYRLLAAAVKLEQFSWFSRGYLPEA